MNSYPGNAGSITAQSVPLFASSWIALFFLIRHSISGEAEQARPAVEPREQPAQAGD